MEEKNIENFHIPRWSELPNIDLYIDQVICYLDDSLANYVVKETDGHVLTKTMINNYVKHSVIKPAVNKKYGKDHLARLFFVCILKQLYSINDIINIFTIATEDSDIKRIYDDFCNELEEAISTMFIKHEHIDFSNNTSMLKNIAVSFVYKLYVDKIYLKKF